MIKLLFIGDRHNSESIPKSRVDDYHTACEQKDKEIISIAKKNNVSAILHPGDFWTDSDRKLGNEFISKVARRWLSAGIPVIGIAGNHDLIGNNEGSLPSTTTGLLSSLGIFKTLSPGEVARFCDEDTDVAVTGTNYHKGMDKKEFLSDYIVDKKRGKVHIHLVHGMLSPKSLGRIIRHTTIDEIKETKADITLCGHDHVGFGIINYHDKYFVNPGAVVRMTCDVKEIEREVSVVLITIDQENISLEKIPLSSAKPGCEVLSREVIEEAKEKIRYQDFVRDGVEKLNIGSTLSISDVLEEIYNEESVSEEIRNSIEKKIIEKKGNVKDKALAAPSGTDIVKIDVHNFQSHADTIVDLSNRFNVIVGESHQGKSALLRAIRWVAEGKPVGKGIIRIGQTEAFVELTLGNGTIIRKFISSKENGYKVYLPTGEVLEGNTKMIPQVQALMGWNSMPIGENEDIPLNHLRQGDSWYLIGDKYSPTDRARILGAISQTEGADAAIKDFDKENNKITDEVKRETIEIVNLQCEIQTTQAKKEEAVYIRSILIKARTAQKIKSYLAQKEDLSEKQRQLDAIDDVFNEDEVRCLVDGVRDKFDKQRKVTGYLTVIETENARIRKIDGYLPELTLVENAERLIDPVKRNLERMVRIDTLSQSYKSAQELYVKSEIIEKQASQIDESALTDVRDKIKAVEVLERAIGTISKSQRTIRLADYTIQNAALIDGIEDDIQKVMDRIQQMATIEELLAKREKLNQDTIDRDRDLDRAGKNYEVALESKLQVLREAHICPTCYASITDEIIEKIINEETSP